MRFTNRAYATFAVLAAIAILGASSQLLGQSVTTNPFRPVYGWGELPEGREWGSRQLPLAPVRI